MNWNLFKFFMLLMIGNLLFLISSCNSNSSPVQEEATNVSELPEEKKEEAPIQIQQMDPNQYGAIETMNFASGDKNLVSPKTQVIGISINNKSKAYPIYILSYHHQIKDNLDSQPIWVTYCFKCRTGRIYNPQINGIDLDFQLFGIHNDNSVFTDINTNSIWLQETGKCIQGEYADLELEEFFSEQTSLKNWLAKYPDSEILQYDPKYVSWYQASEKAYRLPTDISTLPREERSIIIGIETNDSAKAYDWEILKQEKVILDKVGDVELILLTSPDNSSFYAYNREVNGQIFYFRPDNEFYIDINTKSKWNFLGKCIEGELEGTQLKPIQAYQQIWQFWNYFHPNTTRY